MEIKLTNGDRLTIPEGCKATVNGNEIVIEKVQQKFKEGDILTSEFYNYKTIIIFKCYENEMDGLSYFNTEGFREAHWIMDDFRYATEEEKQFLFDKMKEQGLQWNAEKKRVEKVRWRAKLNEDYWYFSDCLDVQLTTEVYLTEDDKRHLSSNYFRTREQAERAAEAVKETLRKFHEEND